MKCPDVLSDIHTQDGVISHTLQLPPWQQPSCRHEQPAGNQAMSSPNDQRFRLGCSMCYLLPSSLLSACLSCKVVDAGHCSFAMRAAPPQLVSLENIGSSLHSRCTPFTCLWLPAFASQILQPLQGSKEGFRVWG